MSRWNLMLQKAEIKEYAIKIAQGLISLVDTRKAFLDMELRRDMEFVTSFQEKAVTERKISECHLLLSSYAIHCYHKNALKQPTASAEITVWCPAQSHLISNSSSTVHQSSLRTNYQKTPLKQQRTQSRSFLGKNMVLSKTLRKGEFGEVLKAIAFRPKGNTGYTTVAVKMLKDSGTLRTAQSPASNQSVSL
ncbi:Proto-oncogene tyrosine-protein kinase receptor Ret [Varanus komodoensis]|nr:Proto-oncogene tyrosine-protein kinase receptor Ret [Varanus komodoensis]